MGSEMKKALITGITGQDGQHLAELLLEKGYKVIGLVRDTKSHKVNEITQRHPEIEFEVGDLADTSSLFKILAKIKPDEIYNLGAISFVGLSFQNPESTSNITALGPLRLLESVRKLELVDTKIYQASSSEMFGRTKTFSQNESTPFNPRTPYGVAKSFAHYNCTNYRETYGLNISCGILFNHEGPFRGREYVTRKISSNVARIKLGKIDKFSLGNIDTCRDLGFAGDYVKAMWMMLQQDHPDDYVIATGEAHSVRDFVETALEVAGLYVDVERYVTLDEQSLRPSEVDTLIGDSTKAHRALNWKPQTKFQELVNLMVENDLQIESTNSR